MKAKLELQVQQANGKIAVLRGDIKVTFMEKDEHDLGPCRPIDLVITLPNGHLLWWSE